MRRLLDHFLDWLGYKLFGHLDDVEYTPEDFEAEAALHELLEAVVAEAEEIVRDATGRSS